MFSSFQPPFLIIFHIFSLVYAKNKAEMAKFEHFLGFE